MKEFTYFLWIWIFILILLIINNIYIKKKSTKENFLPGIRLLYRPYIRNTRLYAENFANTYNYDFIRRQFVKYGLF